MPDNAAPSPSAAGDPVASAHEALSFVAEGQCLGLGTGRAASAFVRALGERVRDGLQVTGVPTSEATASLAREVGVPLTTLEEAGRLDTTFDGADEVDPKLDVIKGYGGAHVREKIVAASSDQLVILVGDEKLVDTLGQRGRLPVEVIPFGLTIAARELAALGCETVRRVDDQGVPVVSDNGNAILDASVTSIDDPAGLDRAILAIPGVLGTGLFVGMADAVIVQSGESVEVRRR